MVNSGSFVNYQKKTHHNHIGSSSSGGRGAARGRGRGGSRSFSDRSEHSEHGGSTLTHPAPTQSCSKEAEEEEILWNMPKADSSLGTFDEEGNFKVSPSSGGSELELISSSSAKNPMDIKFGSFSPRDDATMLPGHDRLPPPNARGLKSAASAVRPTKSNEQGPPAALRNDALISEATMWLYRDPSGVTQGPFSNKKMLHWYSRNYFPETLPLKREEDLLFEPLNAWKIKLGGICPFEIPASSISSNKDPLASSASPPQGQASNILSQLGLPWTGPSSREDANVPAAVSLPKGNVVKEAAKASSLSSMQNLADDQVKFLERLGTKSTTTPTQSPSGSLTRGISISLAQLGLADPAESSSPTLSSHSIEQRKPSWKKIDPINEPFDIGSSLCQPKGSIEPRQHAFNERQLVSSAPQNKPSAAAAVAATTAVTAPASKTKISPLELLPAASPIVGWSKPVSNTKSLAEIMQEEAEAEEARRTLQSSTFSTQPKSFAEMLRKQGASTQFASPPQLGLLKPTSAPQPPSTKKPTSPIVSGTVAKSTSNGATLAPSAASPKDDLKSWCMAQLQPLESSYDVGMCTILLLELKNPAEVVSFIEDNMKSTKMNMKQFSEKLIERRFGGKKMAEPTVEETQFVTVGRKARKPTKN